MSTRNPQAVVARRWLVVTVFGALGIVFPSLLGMDGFSGGYALSLVSGFIALTGGIASWVYLTRAAALGRLLDGDDVVAHWTYDAEQGARFAAAQLEREAQDRRLVFRLICGFALPIGLLFFALDPGRGGRAVLATMVALCVFTWLLTQLFARRAAMRAKLTPEAWIGLEAVWMSGVFHRWGQLGSRMESVRSVHAGPDLELELVYSYPVRGGRQRTSVRVPVPAGREAEGERVVLVLRADKVAES